MADEILSGLRGIKTELRAVQDQMAGLDAGSQEFVKLSQKAGELRDRMKDVKEAVNANAGPAITSFGNNLSIARGQLMELDLQGFGESLKRVGENIKGVDIKSFKDGLKSMAEGFVNVGKALLSNPLFLVAATIAAAAVALNAYMQSQKEKMEKFVASIDKAIEDRQRKEQLYQAQNDLTTRREYERNQKLREKELKDIELQMYLIGQMKMNAQLTEEEYSKRHEELYKRKNQVEIEYATDAKKITEQTVKFKEKLDNEYELSRLNERDRFRKLNKDAERQAIKEAFDLGINDLNTQNQIRLTYNQKLRDQEAKWAEEDAEKAKAAAEKKKADNEKALQEAIRLREEDQKNFTDVMQSRDATLVSGTSKQIELQTSLTQVTISEEEKRTMAERKAANERQEIYAAAWYAKYELASATTDAMINLNNALTESGLVSAEKGFKIGKGLSIAQTTIATIQGVQNALSAVTTIPDPFGTALKIANAVSIGAAGAANIAKIAKTQFNAPDAGVQPTTTVGGGGGGGAMSAPSAQSPSALNLSFLQGNVNTAPLQTYVLAGQVSNAQQAEFKIKNTASILGGG
jgi:hypothetical protein